MKAVFNRATEEFLYYTDGRVDWDKHLIKDLGNIDPTSHAYVGTYSDGEVLSIHSDEYNLKQSERLAGQPKDIFERDLDKTTTERIEGRHGYPIHRQLNIIMGVIEQQGDLKTDEFSEMLKVINAERNQNKRRKDEMMGDTESFNYISKGNEDKLIDDKLGELVTKINAE